MRNIVDHYSPPSPETSATNDAPPLPIPQTHEAIQTLQSDLRSTSAELQVAPQDQHNEYMTRLLAGIAALEQSEHAYPLEVTTVLAEVAGNVHSVYGTPALDQAVKETVYEHKDDPPASHAATMLEVANGVTRLSGAYGSPVINRVLERLARYYAENTGNRYVDETNNEARLALMLAIIGTTQDRPFAEALISAGPQVDALQGRSWDHDVLEHTESAAALKREQDEQRRERERRMQAEDTAAPSVRMSLEDLMKDDAESTSQRYSLKIEGIRGITDEKYERLAFNNELAELRAVQDERNERLPSEQEISDLIAQARALSQS